MQRLILLSAFALTLAAAQAPQPKNPTDLEKLGPQVGERVPDFNLPDQNGTTRTLKSILGPNGAMLVFYRSADW
jgi:cytochrome oxidase Cu insertion factor (SCO1/SenC/PrrC family)